MKTERSSIPQEDKIMKILSDPEQIKKAIQTGIDAALRRHKQAGNPICVWKDNKVVWIKPENIP